MHFLLAALSLSRPTNCFLAAFAAWVGAYTSGIQPLTAQAAWACAASLAMTAAGNVSNDIADIEIDRLAKPQRPLASELIDSRQAWIFFAIFFGAGALSGFAAGPLHGILAVMAGGLLLLYNFRLKRVPLAGNFLVALLSGFPFLYGGLVSRTWHWSLIPFGFAALVHLGREILKSLEDRTGDMLHGVHTIAAIVSERKLRWAAAAVFTVMLLASLLPYLLGWYGPLYLAVLLTGVAVPQGAVLFQLLWIRRLNFSMIHGLLKIEMLAGSIAVLLGR